MIPSDVGRPLNDLARKFKDDDLTDDARSVLEKLVPIHREIVSESRRTYVRRILPYRTTDNRIDGVVITFIEITDLKRAEGSLRESEEQHRLILDALGEYAIFALNREGSIATWNAPAERVVGFTQAEAMGQKLDFLLAPSDRDAARRGDLLRQAQLKGSVADEGWYVRKDGTRFWGSGTLAALRTSAGELRGYVKLLRDHTDRKRHEEALQSAKTIAEAVSDAKDSFLANVSQELRAPLSTIVLWSRLLEESQGSNAVQAGEALKAIKASADELRELVEGLVETSRILSGQLRLEIRSVELASAVTAAVEKLQPAAASKGITIEKNLDRRLEKIPADAERLQQMIANVLTNAVKFAPKDSRLTLSTGTQNGIATIRVSHSGGAPNKLSSAESVVAEQLSGIAGPDGPLRLAITRQLAEFHGGALVAQKDPNTGAVVFALELPLKR